MQVLGRHRLFSPSDHRESSLEMVNGGALLDNEKTDEAICRMPNRSMARTSDEIILSLVLIVLISLHSSLYID